VWLHSMLPLPLACMLASATASEASVATVSLSIDPTNVTHRLRELDMGCHSDTGYSHQPMGLHAQRICKT